MPPQYSLGHSHAGNGSPYGAGCLLEIREQPRLVDELGRRQVVEPTMERRVRELGDRREQRERDIVADDGGDLEGGVYPPEQAGRCALPASPGRWLGAGSPGPVASANTVRAPPPARSFPPASGGNGASAQQEEAAEFRDDMLAFWTATLHG